MRFKTDGAAGNEQLLFVTVVLTCDGDDIQLFFTVASTTLTTIVASVMTIENAIASLSNSPYDKAVETLGILVPVVSINSIMNYELNDVEVKTGFTEFVSHTHFF